MTADAAPNPNKDLWEKGDFTRIARTMRTSGTALVDQLGLSAGMKVLDLGCGDGTTALPAARLGAEVLGVDIAANLVTAGNERAIAEGLANVRFEEGDAKLDTRPRRLAEQTNCTMNSPSSLTARTPAARTGLPSARAICSSRQPNRPQRIERSRS